MPIPYILDPFQRIIAFGRTITSYEYRFQSCATGNSGAITEKRSKITQIGIDGSVTSITYTAWTTLNNQCFLSGPFQVWIGGGPWGSASPYSQEFDSGGTGGSGLLNIGIYASGWKPPGFPNTRPGTGQPVYYDIYMNDEFLVTNTRNTLDFYSLSGTLSAYDWMPGKVMPVGSLVDYEYPSLGNSGTPLPAGTLRIQNNEGSDRYRHKTISAGTPYDIKVVVRIPVYGQQFTGHNVAIWV